MATRVAINGFGRIGRAAFRAAYERARTSSASPINDIADPAMLAHLLAYDSVYGPFRGRGRGGDGGIVVDGHEIAILAETDPAALPWEELGVDVVIESHRAVPDARGRRGAPRGRRTQGDRLGAR